jgi:hypothetical protein
VGFRSGLAENCLSLSRCRASLPPFMLRYSGSPLHSASPLAVAGELTLTTDHAEREIALRIVLLNHLGRWRALSTSLVTARYARTAVLVIFCEKSRPMSNLGIMCASYEGQYSG